LGATLAAIAEAYGEREIAVARELTKKFEEVVTGSTSELAERYSGHEPKGEIVLIVGPPSEDIVVEAGDVDAALREALATMSAAKAAGAIAKRFGLERSGVYARVNAMKSK
jgi:16S rRNA (cytidine1402-2'-O)-methyltransferase